LGLDGFSLIVYVLLIEPENKLVKLLQVIDWGEIDQRCAEVYENAERGARAYAPQVLFRSSTAKVTMGRWQVGASSSVEPVV